MDEEEEEAGEQERAAVPEMLLEFITSSRDPRDDLDTPQPCSPFVITSICTK